jgi:hypothetical protein
VREDAQRRDSGKSLASQEKEWTRVIEDRQRAQLHGESQDMLARDNARI